MEIRTIGVVGAGTMGRGIAQVAAEKGFNVILRDIEDGLVNDGLNRIKSYLEKAVEKGKKGKGEVEETLKRLHGTSLLDDLSPADLVIEAVVENMELKKDLYSELDRVCPPGVIFASNTSGLSITEMAAATNRAHLVIGMHFFNPVPVMKLVEVIRGTETSDETYDRVMGLAQKFGKEPITVNEAPLFVVNRILVPMINEAAFVLMEGVASREDIDRGMVLGANHPVGPLALADLVGLDVLLAVLDTIYKETGDSKYRACPLIRKLVRAGYLGRKSGKGFYLYS